MARRLHPILEFLYNNSLSIAFFSLFVLFIVGLSFFGWQHENQELRDHGWPRVAYHEYIFSSSFGEAVFENWESEFLQMWALVMLTIFLRQKGSPDSKKLHGKESVDAEPKYSIAKASNWPVRMRAVGHFLYANSLGLILLSLFIFSFLLHLISGTAAYNEEARQHGQDFVSVFEYGMSSQFWFESMQNWQSEFLAVGSLLVLAIFFRQRGSTESKPIYESNEKTGK